MISLGLSNSLTKLLLGSACCFMLAGCPSPAERAARVRAQNQSFHNSIEFSMKMGAGPLVESSTSDPTNLNKIKLQLSQAWFDVPTQKQQQKLAAWTTLWRQIVKANPASDQEAELVILDPPPRMPAIFRMGK